MPNLNNGSIWEAVSGIVLDIPSSIGSQTGFEICDRARIFVQNWTQNGIGSNAITETYQSAIVHKAAGNLLNTMNLIGADASKIKVGDITVEKGKTMTSATASEYFNKMAMEELQGIGRKTFFSQVYG